MLYDSTYREVFMPTINASPVPFGPSGYSPGTHSRLIPGHVYTNSNDLGVTLGIFIKAALTYYKDRKLTKAIEGMVGRDAPIDSSVISIKSIIDDLKTKFRVFDFGRMYYNTLNAIIWFMAGLSLIWELRTMFTPYQDFYQFLSASYEILSEGGSSSTASNSTYFKLNHICANTIRSILLDLEVLDTTNILEVAIWLDLVEEKFESFRVAYLQLTRTDLALSGRLMPDWIFTWMDLYLFEVAPVRAFPGEITSPAGSMGSDNPL